jgi:hypothetical protein
VTSRLNALLRSWDEARLEPYINLPKINDYVGLYVYAQHLASTLYRDFERDSAPGTKPFLDRLEEWVLNCSDREQQRELFELLFHLRFVARDEMQCLYQTAYRGNVVRWVMDRASLGFDGGWRDALDRELASTWIGSGSDSFHLDSLFHLTSAPARTARRPAWLDIAKFGDPERVSAHMQGKGLTRVVLFEDIIASGTQIRPALEFLATLSPPVDVLVCPLFTTELAYDGLADYLSNPFFTFDPVAVLGGRNLIAKDPTDHEMTRAPDVRELLSLLHPQVQTGTRYTVGPFGFGGLGVLLVQYGNTPDNCIPAVWAHGEKWRGVFPRQARDGGG